MSFAQEVKDFLGTATSTYKALDDAQYSKLKRAYMQAQTDKLNSDLNDPTIKDARVASIEHTRASTAKINDDLNDKESRGANNAYKRSAAALNTSRAGYFDRLGKPVEAPEDPVAAGISAPPARAIRPAIGGAPAPTAPATEPAAPGPMSSLLDEDPQEGTPSTQFAATGGMVQKFADGGMVDEDDDPNDEDDVTPAPAIGPTDVSAQSHKPATTISKDAGHDAVVAGLKYGVSQLGDQTAVPTAVRQQRLGALSRGVGAAPLADMNQIYKKIDPNNEMGESERNINAMSAVYQHKLRTGDAQGAQRAAFMMLQHYRMASQRYAAISAATAEHGDVDGAAKAAMKAYANIPDGKDLKIVKTEKGLQYSFVDEQTGKTIAQGIASPQELASAAMGVATKGFDQFLLSAAGERAPKGAVGGGTPKAPRESDKKTALGAIDEAYDKSFPAKGDQPALGPDEERTIKGNAYRVYQTNPNITHAEAVDVVKRLSSPNAKNPEDKGFAAKQLEDGQGYMVKIGKGAPVRISEEDFDAMASARAEKAEMLKKTTKADGKPGLAGEVMGAIGDYASDEWGRFKNDVSGLAKEYPETTARLKSAGGAIGRFANDVYESTKPVVKGMMNGPGDKPL